MTVKIKQPADFAEFEVGTYFKLVAEPWTSGTPNFSWNVDDQSVVKIQGSATGQEVSGGWH